MLRWDTFLGSGFLLPATSCFFTEAKTLEDRGAGSRGADCPALYVRNPGTTARPSLGSVCWVQALPDLAWLGFHTLLASAQLLPFHSN